jgi:helicase MOV-10
LARLHTYGPVSPNQPKKLKILLVAPSNDATDILIEKLAPYFPPSEMMRVLAYSRSIDQVPTTVRPYVREGLEANQVASKIMSRSVQIVVATVNLAARFWCSGGHGHGGGVKKGHFDVLCVDEAGHATEPEVIAVAATLMNFSNSNTDGNSGHINNPGQLVLAGDPMQLGPIITSELCHKFGMSVSYMERLVKTSPAYGGSGSADNKDNTNHTKNSNDSARTGTGIRSYPPELITLLVRNYRSHPAILKLPNEMFYQNKLVPCGDTMMTHSMVKWEHLPTATKQIKGVRGFPVVFHGVDGENVREGSSPSWYNPQEAMEVVSYVGLLVKHSRPAIRQEDIGVITPYARQVQKIRTILKSQDMGDVKVGSVETFQGQERRCIIISTVRSETDHLSHDLKYNLGFVANEKRFNVAVTRAKALLVVIGSPRVLATDKKNWLPFLQYCRDHGSWMGQEWDEHEHDDADGGDAILDNEWEVVNRPGDDTDTNMVEQQAFGFINREE